MVHILYNIRFIMKYVMENKPNGTDKKDIDELVHTGEKLLEILERMNITGDPEYQKNRNMFIAGYGKWYSRCLPIIRSISPDKAPRFEILYHTNKRMGTNEYTYTIQDYVQGIHFKDRPRSYTDNIAGRKFKEQISILKSVISRKDDFTFDMERFVKINPIHGHPSSSISRQENFLNVEFCDMHYKQIRTEINSGFKRGSFMAVLLLSKELIRNLLADLIRNRFPSFSEEHTSLYYDHNRGTIKDTAELLDVLIAQKRSFELEPDTLEHLIQNINAIEPAITTSSHSFGSVPSQKELKGYGIEDILQILKDANEHLKK